MSERLAVRSGITAGALYIVGFLVAILKLKPLGPTDTLDFHRPQVLAFLFLTLFPPIWFYFESIILYGPGYGSNSDYTHGQDLASRLWLACSFVAAVYWFHKI